MNLSGFSTSRLQALLICGASSCAADGGWGRIALRNAVVTVADSTPPSVRIVGGALVGDGWHAGTQNVVVDASDNVGIRTFRALWDGEVTARLEQSCDDTRANSLSERNADARRKYLRGA